jgi:hypothetical protein
MGKSAIARKGVETGLGCAVFPKDRQSPEEL